MQTSEDLRFCAECKHLLGVRSKPWDAEDWACHHPNNLLKNEPYFNLVTGIQQYLREYQEGSLFILRADPAYCGPNGQWWEEYIEPEYKAEPSIGGKQGRIIIPTEEVFSTAELSASAEAAAKRLAELKAKKKVL